MPKKPVVRIKLPAADCYRLPYKGYVKPSTVRRELSLQKQTLAYKQLRARLLREQDFRCAYCLCDLSGKLANLEHIVPVKAGGTNNPNNLVMACPNCNKEKNNKVIPKHRRVQIRQNVREGKKNLI